MDTCIPNIPSASPPLTEAALCKWIGAAAPGDTLVYHRGFLACDSSAALQLLPEAERVALKRVAGRAWKLADAGLAHLIQRRNGNAEYEYQIVARPRPRRAQPQLLALLLQESA
jgi:hypothetical protein